MIPTAQDWPSAHTAPPPPPPASATQPPGPRPRRALIAVAAVLVLVVGGAVGLGVGLITRGSPAPSSASASPRGSSSAATQARALYQQALAAGNASAGFHYVAISAGGAANQKIVGDAGSDGGTQAITVDSTYGTEQFSLVLVGATVYFQGNAPALRDQLGVAAANAPGLTGAWISVQSDDGPYTVVAPGITVSDQMAETLLAPTSTQSAAAGRIRIVGTATPGGSTGTAHLDVDSASHLPMSYAASGTSGGTTTTSTVTFSGWGKAPSVSAPTRAVAWAKLGASQPPGGYGNGGGPTSQTPQA